jgi:transposase
MARMFDSSPEAGSQGATPDPEVTAKAKRRRFTAQYKLRVLREADALAETGGVGEMLRREGLYSSHLTTWRREREGGELAGLAPRKRGRKVNPNKALEHDNERLAREVARLRARLEQAEAIIAVQKKLSELLGVPMKDDERTGSDS